MDQELEGKGEDSMGRRVPLDSCVPIIFHSTFSVNHKKLPEEIIVIRKEWKEFIDLLREFTGML